MYSYKVLANDPIMGIIFMVVIFEKVGVGLTYLLFFLAGFVSTRDI